MEELETCSYFLKDGYADCGIGGRRLLIRITVFSCTLILIILLIMAAVTEHAAKGASDLIGGSCDQLTPKPIETTETDEPVNDVVNHASDVDESCFETRFPRNFIISIYVATAVAIVLGCIPVMIMFPPTINWNKRYDGNEYINVGTESMEAQAQAGYSKKTFPVLTRVKPSRSQVYDDTYWGKNYQYMNQESNPLKHTNNPIIKEHLKTPTTTRPLYDMKDEGDLGKFVKFMPCEYRPEFSCDLHRLKADPKVAKEIASKYNLSVENLTKMLGSNFDGQIPEKTWKECEWKNGGSQIIKKNGCVDKKTISNWNNCELCYNKTSSCSSEKRGYVSAAIMIVLSICLLTFGILIWIWYFDGKNSDGTPLFGNSNSTRTIESKLEYDENGKIIKGDPDVTISKKLNDGVWAWMGGFSILVGSLTLLAAALIIFVSYTCPRGSGWYEGSSPAGLSFLKPFTQF